MSFSDADASGEGVAPPDVSEPAFGSPVTSQHTEGELPASFPKTAFKQGFGPELTVAFSRTSDNDSFVGFLVFAVNEDEDDDGGGDDSVTAAGSGIVFDGGESLNDSFFASLSSVCLLAVEETFAEAIDRAEATKELASEGRCVWSVFPMAAAPTSIFSSSTAINSRRYLELEGSIGNPSMPAIRRIRSISELISLAAMRLLPWLPSGIAASLPPLVITETFSKRNWWFRFWVSVLLKLLILERQFPTGCGMPRRSSFSTFVAFAATASPP